MKKQLGCLSISGTITVIVTLVVITGFILLGGGTIFSPGPLNGQVGDETLGGVNSHAGLSKECGACHTPPWSRETMAERCRICHTGITLELQTSTSLHGAMMAQSPLLCRECHPDHNGVNASMTIIDTMRFPHPEATGYALLAHQKMSNGQTLACAECHQQDLGQFDVHTCATCHQDIDIAFAQTHVDAFGQDCLACHDGVDTYGAAFDHNQTDFPLEGDHALEDCTGCHQDMHTLADLQATEQACYACHQQDDVHQNQFGQNCAVCHTPTDWDEVTFDHALTNFPLLGAHGEVECTACHLNKLFKDTPPACYACHQKDDAHQGQFGQDCAECHTSVTWEEATFDHALTDFPLTNAHEQVECESCHLNNIFVGTSQLCYDCHLQDDVHLGQFGRECTTCHTSVSWEEATFDHALTDFPLTGAHKRVECESCHIGGMFQNTARECSACHLEPILHIGMFEATCADCHTTNTWTPAEYNLPHTFPFDHERRGQPWTCIDCHPTSLQTYTCYQGCHEHTPAKVEREHREEGIRDFQNCMECHPTGREDEGESGGDGD